MSDENIQSSETTESIASTVVAQPESNWLDSLPDDVKNDASLSNFKGKDVSEVVKSYVSAQRMLGSSIRIPGPDASKEARAEFMKKIESVPGVTRLPDPNDVEATKSFFNKIGTPDAPEKYKFDLPENVKLDEQAANSFKQFAHNLGLTNKQASELVKFDVAQKQAQAQALDVGREQSSQLLKQEWGNEYQNRLGMASDLLKHYETKFPEAANEIRNGAAGNNPIILMALAELSKTYRESGVIKGDRATSGHSPEEAKARIQEIRSNPEHPFNSKKQDKMHYDAVAEMDRLYSAAYPEEKNS